MNLTGADLFCGAGGTSSGILQAVASMGRSMDLLAVNHWRTAVNTHTLNHPGVRHLCMTLDDVVPQRVIPGGRLNLLAGSPECTLRRIAAGLRKFGGANAEPFLVILNGTASGQIPHTVKSVDAPMPTQTACGHIALFDPFLVAVNHGQDSAPRGTDGRRVRSVDEPVPTITTAHRGELALIQPQINPFVLGQQSCAAPRSTEEPLPTICCDGGIALVKPFIVKYYGTATANSIGEPLDTITTKDRFMLVEPKSGRTVAELDILFRMLQPQELAAAMSFPKGYQFYGNRGDQVKQIGNAVPVNLARACAHALLTN